MLPVRQTDREAAVEALQRAAGDGRLPLNKFSERVGTALTAETRGQLDTATAGLEAAPTRRIDAYGLLCRHLLRPPAADRPLAAAGRAPRSLVVR
jgi:hypothetical protein